MKTVYAIDCETDPFDSVTTDIRPFLWDIYDGKKHYTYEHMSDVHDFIESHTGIYYAHNGGKFDYHLGGFCNKIENGEKILVINGRLAKFRMLGSEFRDSFCILPHKLSELGAKIDIDYSKLLKSERKKHWAEIVAYLHGDTEVLRKVVVAFRESYGGGITLAGAALQQLRKRLPPGEDIPALSAKTDALVRPFYFGGRVECLTRGIVKKPFKSFDISSAYPFAMIHPHAWGEAKTEDCPSTRAAIDPCAFYHVLATSRGALPLRKPGGGLSFPDSKAVFNATGWEIQAGLDTGTLVVHQVYKRVSFLRTCDFSGHVNHFYRLKSEEPKGSHGRLFCKLILNSSYGKLGCDPTAYSNYYVVDEKTASECMEMGKNKGMQIGDRHIISEPLEDYEQRRKHVGAAASITGFVRAMLWREMCAVRRRGGDILYCDTDCIMVAGADIRTGKGLGAWELDADCVAGAFAGKKMYALTLRDGTKKIASKGVVLTAKQIENIAQGGEVAYTKMAPIYSIKNPPKILKRVARWT